MTDPAASANHIRCEDANVSTHIASTKTRAHCYSIWSLSVTAVKNRLFEHGRYPGCRKATSNDVAKDEMGPALKRHDKGCELSASTVVPD